MNQNDRFNDILNECLDRLFKGETVEQCLNKYPEQARELEPLLRTAVAARVASTIQPCPEFKSRARYQFQAALRDMEVKKNQRRSFFAWRWQWQSGWAVALVGIIVVVLGGGGTAVAASNSMPDNALYSVKLTTEQIQLAVIPSDVGKAELNSKFADRRAEEIVYMASKGDAQQVQIIAQRLNTNLENITSIVTSNTGPAAPSQSAGGAAPGSGETSGQPMLGINSASPELNDQSPTPAEPMMGIAAAPAPSLSAPGPNSTPEPGAVPAITPAATEPAPAVAPAPPPMAAPAARALEPEATPTTPAVDSSSKSANRDLNATGTATGSNLSSADREKIKQIIVNAFNIRQALLEKALAEASPEVRPAVRQAIALSLAEYEKALSQLQ